MKLPQLVNNLLENLYTCFSPAGIQGSYPPETSFYEMIILPAMRSETFRRRLLDDPQSMLTDFGMVLPAGMTVRFLENTEGTIHIVIPPYIGE